MSRWIPTALLALVVSTAQAAEVINVEFQFTPFVGDPATEDQVVTVEGKARVMLNGILYAEQEVSRDTVPVLFDEREISPAVWLPTASCGPALRKGKNTVRFEFEPADAKTRYRAQLRTTNVMSESTEESEEGHYSATNQSGTRVEEKEVQGPVVFEQEFQADFAVDLSWHHNPAIPALGDTDRKALATLVAERVRLFQPDFGKLYAILEGDAHLDLAQVKQSKCLDQAYAAGVRIAAAPVDEMEFLTTGGPAVVVRAKKGMLFNPPDMSVIEKIKDEDILMCAGIVLSAIYPPRLVAVRDASGGWAVAY